MFNSCRKFAFIFCKSICFSRECNFRCYCLFFQPVFDIEIFATVTMMIVIFYDVTPFSLVRTDYCSNTLPSTQLSSTHYWCLSSLLIWRCSFETASSSFRRLDTKLKKRSD